MARKSYHFLPLDENVYVHGGLTPEETLIPVAIYKPVTVSANPLAILLISNSKIYVGTKADLKFDVTNLNNYSCEGISIEIADQNFDAEAIYLDTLPKLDRTQVSTVARCLRTADRSAKDMIIKVSFHFLGQPVEHFTQIPVELVDPATPKFDFEKF